MSRAYRILGFLLAALIIGTAVSIILTDWPMRALRTSGVVGGKAFGVPFVAAQISPQDILFADTFDLTLRVTVDTRTVDPNSVDFVIPTDGLVVHSDPESTREYESPSTVVVAKTVTLQCLSCLPYDRPYRLGDSAVIFTGRDGKLRSMIVRPPDLRVHSRLFPQDIERGAQSLRPQRPAPPLWHPGHDLAGTFFWIGVIVLFVGGLATLFMARRSPKPTLDPGTAPRQKEPYQRQRETIARLREFLTEHDALADEAMQTRFEHAVGEAYLAFREVSDLLGSTRKDGKERISSFKERFSWAYFDVPERVFSKKEELMGLLVDFENMMQEEVRLPEESFGKDTEA